MSPRSFPRCSFAVTGNGLSVLPTDLEVIDRQCRHAADVFIGRDAGKLALHAGMRQQQISRQREIVEDTIPALAKVARLVVAGQVIGRSFEDFAALLLPVTDLAAGSLSPWLPVVHQEDLVEQADLLAAGSLEAHGEAIAALVKACSDHRVSPAERAAIRTKLRRSAVALQTLIDLNEEAGKETSR